MSMSRDHSTNYRRHFIDFLLETSSAHISIDPFSGKLAKHDINTGKKISKLYIENPR